MTKHCLQCDEVWNFEDYVCPECESCAVDVNSKLPITIKLVKTGVNTFQVVDAKQIKLESCEKGGE